MNNKNKSRRDFLKKATYVAPAIVSLKAIPSFANTGSNRPTTTGPVVIDLGPGCTRRNLGVGDGEIIRDRHSICE